MMAGYFVLTLLVLIVDGVFGVEVTVTVKKGDSVTLKSDVTKKTHDIVHWYFNGTLIAFINGGPDTSCFYGEIIRDRLKVNYDTGSLTITNISPEHTGHYELEYIKDDNTGINIDLERKTGSKNEVKCQKNKDIKISSIEKTINVIVTAAENTEFQRAETMIPGSAQSPVGKAGIFVGVVAVAVVLLM